MDQYTPKLNSCDNNLCLPTGTKFHKNPSGSSENETYRQFPVQDFNIFTVMKVQVLVCWAVHHVVMW
jgi:hypothetical protein